jgi:zinc protease
VTLAVVGDVDPSMVLEEMESHFYRLTPSEGKAIETPDWPRGGLSHAEITERAQTALALVWPAPCRTDDRRYSMTILAEIAGGFGGRLFAELRQKRALCYSVRASLSTMRAAGMLVFFVQTAPEKEDEAREALVREAREFQLASISADDLRQAQAQVVGGYTMHRQSGAVLLAQLADSVMFGSSTELIDFERRHRDVTLASIRETARDFLSNDSQLEVVIRGRR